jgi:Zn-dependent M28 family amino/carboxypeptidase
LTDQRALPMLALPMLALVACNGSRPAAPRAPPPAVVDPLTADRLIEHVRALVAPELDGREAATPGERAGFRYVADQLRATGLTPVELAVVFGAGSRNLYARVDGTNRDEVIVVGAHVDHLGRKDDALYGGADDNASGVAVVLGVTAALAHRRGDLARSVLVVFFGAEEPGMVGSRQFVAAPPVPLAQIAAMVNVDMIGRPLLDQPLLRAAMPLLGIDAERSTGLVGARHYPGLRALADAAFATQKQELVAAEDLPDEIGDEVERQSQGRGDSVSFEARGIPALFFGDGESSDYHQPSDTLDKLEPQLLEGRARALVQVVVELTRAPKAAFARSDAVPPKRKPPR